MKQLIKVMLILGSIFALTFILGRLLGILTVENVKLWLEYAQSINPIWIVGTVIVLLFMDLFIAVPTLTITILAGYFLGFPYGAAAALIGMSSASICGYLISKKWGDRAISLIVKSEAERIEMAEAFQKNGPAMITLSRAAPMVPEVTACMAGATNMSFKRFLTFFYLGTVPYVLIASYAGSISSVNSPQPAIYAAITLYAVLWVCWYIYRRKLRRAARV